MASHNTLQWTTTTLSNLGLSEHAERFAGERIGRTSFLALTDNQLRSAPLKVFILLCSFYTDQPHQVLNHEHRSRILGLQTLLSSFETIANLQSELSGSLGSSDQNNNLNKVLE